MSLTPGALLINRYRIESILGQGGMGAVYCARDENLGVHVAVKENLFLSDEYARQFQREAVILASLRHPNLPRVGDYFTMPNQGQYLIMDYIEGEDLRERIERIQTLPEKEVALIGAVICDALTYLHTRRPPVVHRDIKPGNIKITPEGEVVLVDFGLAKVMLGSQATTTGARAMTPGYSPPEQYGTARTDSRTDIYSLGATLYAALTGVIPEDGLGRATGKEQLTPIRSLQPRITKRLSNVIEKSLEIEPEDRYQTAEEFKVDLLAALDLSHLTQPRLTVPPAPPKNSNAEERSATLPTDPDFGDGPSKPPSRPPARSSKPKRKGAPVWPWILVLLLLAVAMGAVIYIRPDLPSAIIGRLMPSPTYTLSPQPSSTTAPPTETATLPSPTISNTLPVGVINSETPVPTSTLTPTITLTPIYSYTPTASPTPVGGGFGEIAFASNRSKTVQIWTMDQGGGNQRQLTNLPEGACQPAWSPDGEILAFISPCTERRDLYNGSKIYLMNANGTNIRILPVQPNPAGDFDPAWSPDGKKIAFTSLRTGNARIFIFEMGINSLREISNSETIDRSPSWSPDGTLIAFMRQNVTSEIWTMSPNGENQQRFSGKTNNNDYWPLWSKDGNLIMYSQVLNNIPTLIGLRLENRGTQNEFLIPPNNQNIGPVAEASLSPDGLMIVFESWPDGANHDIYRMSINGADRQPLTDHPGYDFSPSWRPSPAKP